jgi:hypothetical protein
MSVCSRIVSIVLAGVSALVGFTGCADIAVNEVTSVSSALVTLTPVARINFQPDAAPVPAGYTKDIGLGYVGGQGWIREDSLSGAHTALDISPNTRDRNRAGIDQRLDTVIHMQFPPANPNLTAIKIRAAFELAVPAGTYRVTASVGDAPPYDSTHVIRVEGITAINGFVGSASIEFSQATVDVVVNDGRLTVDGVGGTNTKLNFLDVSRVDNSDGRPSVRSVSPVNGATGVNPTGFVSADVNLPNVGGIDESTLTASNVFVARTSDGIAVPAVLNTSGGGDVIVLQPSATLAGNTSYRVTITDNLRDTTGARFVPFSSTFTTGNTPPITSHGFQFEKVALFASASGRDFTSLTVGPDGKLYAATMAGQIVRFDMNADGTLANALVINTLVTAEGGPRAIVGLTFDPAATAGNLVLWVSHAVSTLEGAPDWTSKLSKLTGTTLGTLQHVVIGLPRSVRDHLTNSIAFKPGEPGVLYISQGSTSAMGAPDNAWGLRPERLLTAAVLRLDTAKLGALPLNVKTEDGGSYNPTGSNAPLTIFATGIRNAYDLVWHSNGSLYVPTNGSAAGGNTPATPAPLPPACNSRSDGPYTGPTVPGLFSVGTESDYLFRVVAGGYYGHPNPLRCEWVMNGGNPTTGNDLAQRPEYPVGTQPDRNWRGIAFDFGEHFSPNGVVEYSSSFFGAGLRGKLVVARYSGGDDLVVLSINPTTKNVSLAETGAPGTGGFGDPLDVAENKANGNLYVSEYGARKITLLRPVSTVPAPWVGGDIGAVGPAGSTTHANGTFTIEASGADIFGTADAFRFTRQQRTGDFTLTARVASLQNTNTVAKAGVMIRETLAANAKNVFVALTPTGGAKFTRRSAVGGTTLVTTFTGWTTPNWVRVQRQGSTFRGYVSTNGTTWTQVGADATIAMNASVYLGLAVTSHNNAVRTTAAFTNVTLP